MSAQRGLTLVELLVAIAITSLVLVAIAGVTQVGQQVEATWSNAIHNAQTANRLASWLQRDAHRYTPCAAAADHLELCLVSSNGSGQPPTRTTVITYQMSASDLVRADNSTGASAVVARGVPPPGFNYQIYCGPGVATGTITVSSPTLQIPFRAPVAGCQP